MKEKRLNFFKQMKDFFSFVFSKSDEDIKSYHISLYLFLLHQNNRTEWVEWNKCPFDIGMIGSGIGNKSTYYKALKDLERLGVIDYRPGVNNWSAPMVRIKEIAVRNRTSTVPQFEPAEGSQVEPAEVPAEVLALQPLLGALLGRYKDLKTLRPIDLKTYICEFSSFVENQLEKIEKVNPQSDDELRGTPPELIPQTPSVYIPADASVKARLLDELMQWFGFTEMNNFAQYREANSFLFILDADGRVNQFVEQFTAYKSFKTESKQIKHHFKKFLGTIEHRFTDGGWCAENWVQKSKELNSATAPGEQLNKADELRKILKDG